MESTVTPQISVTITVHYALAVVSKVINAKVPVSVSIVTTEVEKLMGQYEQQSVLQKDPPAFPIDHMDRRQSQPRGVTTLISSVSDQPIENVLTESATIGAGSTKKQNKWFLYSKEGKEELLVSLDKVFKDSVHIVVRFQNDPELLIKNCKESGQRFINETATANLDGLGLSSTSKIPSAKVEAEGSNEYNIAVYLSNPLVTKQQQQFIVSKEYHQYSRNRNSEDKQSVRTVWTYDKEPETEASQQEFFSNLKMKQAKVNQVIEHAEFKKMKSNTKIKIRQLHCRVQMNQEGVVFFGLEDDELVGTENQVPVSEVLKGLPKDSLLVVIGLRADLAIDLNQGEAPLIVAINTPHFSADVLAITFLERFYERLFSRDLNTFTSEEWVTDFEYTYHKLMDPNMNTRQIQSNLCCCNHDHTSDCRFKMLSNIYGMHTCHQQYHRHCTRMNINMCRENKCPENKICSILSQEIGGNVGSCYNFCCCKSRTVRQDKVIALSDDHNLCAKFKISRKLDRQTTEPQQTINVQPSTSNVTFSKPLFKYALRMGSAIHYKAVWSIARPIAFDAQVKIYVVTGEDADFTVRSILLKRAIQYVNCRVDSDFTKLQLDLQRKYPASIKELIEGRLQQEEHIKGFLSRFQFPTKVIILHNCPEQQPSQEEVRNFEKSLLNFGNQLGGKVRLRIFLVGKNPARMSCAQTLSYNNFGVSQFIYRLAQQSRDDNSASSADTFLLGVRGLADVLQAVLDRKSIELDRNLISWKNIQKKLKEMPNSPIPSTTNLGGCDIQQPAYNQETFFAGLNDHQQRFIARTSLFPNGLTELELSAIPDLHRVWKKVFKHFRKQVISMEMDPRWNSSRIKVLLKVPENRIRPSDEIVVMKYLAQYAGAALHNSDNPKKAQESMQEGSALSSMGIFYYRRYGLEFSEVFEENAFLEDSQKSVHERYSRLAKQIKINRKLSCEDMFKMQETNLIGFLKSHDVEHWESDEELFHYFCMLVLNLSALLKLQQNRGTQISYFQHMEFMNYQVERISNHPKSKRLLYIQLMFTYIGMKRLWSKSTTSDLEATHKRFLLPDDNQMRQDHNEIELAWHVEYCVNRLLGKTSMRTDSYYQKKVFCEYLRKISEAIDQLTLHTNKKYRKKNVMRLRSRMAVLAAEGIMDGGIELIEQMRGIFKEQPDNSEREQSDLDRLQFELTEAFHIFDKSELLKVRSRLCVLFLRLQRGPDQHNVENPESKKSRQQQARSRERKYLQAIKRDLDEFEEKYFDLNRIDYAHKKTYERMRQLRRRLNEKMAEHAKHTFIILVAQTADYNAQAVLYQYQSTMQFLKYGLGSLKINASILMNRLSEKQLVRCCDSGAEVLFLLVDFDLSNQGVVKVNQFDDMATATIPTTNFCSWIALSNCRTVVLCGRNISYLVKIISPTSPPRFSVSPVIIPVDVSTSHTQNSSHLPNILLSNLLREFISKFILSYCELTIRQPKDIYNVFKLDQIYTNIRKGYEKNEKEHLPEAIDPEISLKEPEYHRVSNQNELRLWSEWTRNSSTNLTFQEDSTQTIVTEDVQRIYEKVKTKGGPLTNGCILEQITGPDRKTIVLSVAHLLKYQNRLAGGVYYYNLTHRTEQSMMGILTKQKQNKTAGRRPLADIIYNHETHQQQSNLQDTLLILHFDKPKTGLLAENVKEFIERARTRLRYILLSTEEPLDLKNSIVTQTEPLKKQQLEVLMLELTRVKYAAKHIADRSILLEGLQQIRNSTQLFKYSRQEKNPDRFSLENEAGSSLASNILTASSRRIRIIDDS